MIFDLAFIPSYKCNLSCWFCMYNSGPTVTDTLDIVRASWFVEGWPVFRTNSFGFYGGEISTDYELYQRFIDMVPATPERFTISNGSWSKGMNQTCEFILFCTMNRLWVKVSSTPEHKLHQDEHVLRRLYTYTRGRVYTKANDDTKSRLLPMGRLSHQPFSCTKKCTRVAEPYRIAMIPNGNIIFQSCDGVYPIIGTWESTYIEIKATVKSLIERKRGE